MKIYKIIIIVILIIFIGAVIFIFISTENDNDNNDNVELTITSLNINNNDSEIKNSNISNNVNMTNANLNNSGLLTEDPVFGKEDLYYYRGQENPIIDIELYNDSVIFYSSVLKILKNYPSYTRLTWKSFPLLGIFPDRIYFAEALECAGEQEKFWPFLDAVVSEAGLDIRKSGQEFIDTNQSAIISADLDQNQFNDCFSEERYKELVTDMYNEAINEGIDGVPTTFVNNIKVPGVHENNLRNVVHEELKKKLMQDWKQYYDPDFNFSFIYPDTIQINKVSNPSDDLQRVDLVDKQSDNIFQIYYYKKGADERLTELKNLYNIKLIEIINIAEINQDYVYYSEQLLTMKDNSEIRSKINIEYLDSEIIDGFITVVDNISVEIWGPSSDYSTEFIKVLSIGVEVNK